MYIFSNFVIIRYQKNKINESIAMKIITKYLNLSLSAKFALCISCFMTLILFNSSCSYNREQKRKTQHNNTKTISIKSDSLIKPSYNIYLENSGSMDGYVNGVTSFEQNVYNYLSNIKIMDIADSLNLFYINSKPIPYGSDVADFIEKLEPTTFKRRGGDRGTTDLSNVLKMVLRKTNSETVSILVSDFIFSPGKNKDAEQYLINQQIGVKNIFAEHLKKNPDLAVVIYHLSSQFNGYFYDKNDIPQIYKGNRPYYIWLIGHNNHIKKLIDKCPASKFKGKGVLNTFSIVKGGKTVDYAVKFGTGNFKLDKSDTKRSIVNARKDNKGVGEAKLRLSVNVNFSNLLCNDSYLLDENNYRINDRDFKIRIKNSPDKGYSHRINLSTSIVKPSTLNISIKSRIPMWIDSINDSIGIGINTDNKTKTFGIKHLMSGLYEAFTINGEEYTTLTININK